jgi:hypothetical protein
MDRHSERRRYYPLEENVPLSEAVYEAIEAHEDTSLDADELRLFEHVNPDAIDLLFEDVTEVDVEVMVRINLENVAVSIWSDGGIDIRVTEDAE